MKTLVTMRVEFTKEEDADTLLEALADLENAQDVFPEGADIRKNYDYSFAELASDSDKYKDVCINPQEIPNT
tara:strand:+ start:314 stop:529 length:216 start_codon:yes stop_codon:yes gene_type:complete